MLKDVQTQLAKLGFDPGPADGIDGAKTRAAVKAFQEKFGLVVDGVAGPQTREALKRASDPVQPGQPEPDKSAMLKPVLRVVVPLTTAAAPPNASTLELLSTARPISEIIIHCTATAEGKSYTIADIRAWHKARGFSDIGYHYVVDLDGTILVGRPVGQVGAHVADHNTGTIGISYIGGVAADGKTPRDTRTAAQRASLLWLTAALRAKHKGIRKVTGHNRYASKACPSFDVAKDQLGMAA